MYSEGRLNHGSLQLTQTALCTIIQLPGDSHIQRVAVNGKGCLPRVGQTKCSERRQRLSKIGLGIWIFLGAVFQITSFLSFV